MLQTAENKKAEEAFKERLKERVGVVISTPVFAPFDFISEGVTGLQLWEFKRLNSNLTTYDTFFESVHKIDKCLAIAEELSACFYYVIQYNDCLAYTRIVKGSLPEPRQGGRTDRGRPEDLRPCYFFDVRQLNIIE